MTLTLYAKVLKQVDLMAESGTFFTVYEQNPEILRVFSEKQANELKRTLLF